MGVPSVMDASWQSSLRAVLMPHSLARIRCNSCRRSFSLEGIGKPDIHIVRSQTFAHNLLLPDVRSTESFDCALCAFCVWLSLQRQLQLHPSGCARGATRRWGGESRVAPEKPTFGANLVRPRPIGLLKGNRIAEKALLELYQRWWFNCRKIVNKALNQIQ